MINQASIDRGLYNGSKFTQETSIKDDNKEIFGIPDITKTLDTKATSYDRLTPHGYVPVGTVVNKGDIIIGKYAPLPEGFDKQYQFQDMSVKWNHEETGIVTNVVVGAFEDGKKFIKIGFRKLRSVQLGDKFCIEDSSEILTDKGWVTLKDIDINTCKVATLNAGNLEYVSASQKFMYDHDDDMYHLKLPGELEISCTLNHKLYVKPTTHHKSIACTKHHERLNGRFKRNEFQFIQAKDVMGRCMEFKNDVNNIYPKIKLDEIQQKEIENSFINGCLPKFVWNLDKENCNKILDSYLELKDNDGKRFIYTDNANLANDVQRLAFHCGRFANIYQKNNQYKIYVRWMSRPIINYEFNHEHNGQIEEIIKYKGKVGCIEVPNTHLFYYRRSFYDPPCWISNSARSG